MPQITQLHLIKLRQLFVASIFSMQPNGFVTKAAGNLFNCSIVFFLNFLGNGWNTVIC